MQLDISNYKYLLRKYRLTHTIDSDVIKSLGLENTLSEISHQMLKDFNISLDKNKLHIKTYVNHGHYIGWVIDPASKHIIYIEPLGAHGQPKTRALQSRPDIEVYLNVLARAGYKHMTAASRQKDNCSCGAIVQDTVLRLAVAKRNNQPVPRAAETLPPVPAESMRLRIQLFFIWRSIDEIKARWRSRPYKISNKPKLPEVRFVPPYATLYYCHELKLPKHIITAAQQITSLLSKYLGLLESASKMSSRIEISSDHYYKALYADGLFVMQATLFSALEHFSNNRNKFKGLTEVLEKIYSDLKKLNVKMLPEQTSCNENQGSFKQIEKSLGQLHSDIDKIRNQPYTFSTATSSDTKNNSLNKVVSAMETYKEQYKKQAGAPAKPKLIASKNLLGSNFEFLKFMQVNDISLPDQLKDYWDSKASTSELDNGKDFPLIKAWTPLEKLINDKLTELQTLAQEQKEQQKNKIKSQKQAKMETLTKYQKKISQLEQQREDLTQEAGSKWHKFLLDDERQAFFNLVVDPIDTFMSLSQATASTSRQTGGATTYQTNPSSLMFASKKAPKTDPNQTLLPTSSADGGPRNKSANNNTGCCGVFRRFFS